MSERALNVGLLITCLVDTMRPTVGFATVKLLEDNGCNVYVPKQTCCGQPAYNSGDRQDTLAIAKQNIELFERYDYVVAPSGSCAGMVAAHYPELFRDEASWATRARQLSAKTFEITSFLTDVLKVEAVSAAYRGKVAYHDSCAGLRELLIKQQPRKLLDSVDGLELTPLASEEQCCGFGGTFCIKYSEISDDIVDKKTEDVIGTDADLLLAGDLGCLMNIAGKLKRKGSEIEVRHVVEVLADMTDDVPAIAGKAG
jgi:L-lactate dehydrogenase complex protein LldE